MRIEERVVGSVTILSVSGRVSSRENAAFLKDTITNAVQRGHLHVVLDLQRVPCIDSCGLGAIVGGHTIRRSQWNFTNGISATWWCSTSAAS